MEREGPMWRRDWPEGEDARRAVRFEERVLDSVRRADSLEFKMAVDSVDRLLAHESLLLLLLLSLSLMLAWSLLLRSSLPPSCDCLVRVAAILYYITETD